MNRAACALMIGWASGWLVWEAISAYERHAARARLHRALDRRPFAVSRLTKFFRRRTNPQHQKQFPDFLDLLALGVSTGLTLEKAWISALETLATSPLKTHLLVFEHHLRWGGSRSDAFRDVATRLNDEQFTMTLCLIEQSMNHGHRLRDVLLDQARTLRQRQALLIERRVQTVGLRLLVPIFLFILPAVFLVLFAPLLIRLSQGAGIF